MNSDAKRQAILGGMPKSDIPAFLRSVGVYALQKTAGYIPEQAVFEDEPVTKSVLACDDSYEAYQLLDAILYEFDEIAQRLNLEYTDGHLEDKYTELLDALVKSPHRFIRDILESEYNLPLLRRNMTDEQKKIADILEARLKEDETLRLEGKVRCHLTGIISVVTDERSERNKAAQRQTQVQMNAAFRKL